MSRPKQPQNTAGQSGPKPAGSKRAKESKQAGDPAFPAFQPNAGGSDIGAREIYIAVPPDRDAHPVRKCDTFTGDLHQMAQRLVHCGVTTVKKQIDYGASLWEQRDAMREKRLEARLHKQAAQRGYK